MEDWSKHLHPDDKEVVEKGIKEALASSANQWQQVYRFIKADGSEANVFGRATIIRDAKGKAYRMIGVVHDFSKQKVLEEKLEQEIKLKEKQITEATEDAKSTERSSIGKELHDNVNQLLGASKMYLEMAKYGGNNSEMYLDRASEYTLSAINEIRKLTKGLTSDIIKNFGLCEAIDTIVRDTMEINPIKITYEMKSFKEDSVNDKFKLNMYRIVQEQLSNILKHASAKEVLITIVQKNNSVALNISDNGVGFDTSK
jgi:signal transduction histidine kinase